jgi:threonine dehydratase
VITRAELDAAVRIVRPHVPVTPAYRWPLLERITGTPTWVKHENATPTGAFKVRGGLVYAARLLDAEHPVRGMVTATRGNHGQSLAYAGRAHGIRVTITTPAVDTFVDGIATRVPDGDAVDVMVRGAAPFVQVSDQATEQAMRYLWQTKHHMPEPSGAIALAGLLADTARPDGAVAAVIMTGGNCDREFVQRVVAGP